MLQKYAQQTLQIEQEWYKRDPANNTLKDNMVKWFNPDDELTTIALNADTKLKYFIRSYRAAFEKFINTKVDVEKIDMELKKINQAREKEGKKTFSRAQFLNHSLKSSLKHDICLKLDDVELNISANPSSSHLGNGHIREIGKYSDIWPTLNLITDCKPENNQKLAELFLKFADSPSKFTKAQLGEINPKFLKPEFAQTTEYFRKFLTGIAMHFIFFESARRVVLTEEEGGFTADAPQNIPIASSIITALKAMKDGYITKLEDAFSPDSKYILITKDGVNSLSQQITKSTIDNMTKLGINRVKGEYHKKTLSPNDMAAHYLYPDSESYDSNDTEDYKGKKVKLPVKSGMF